MGWHKTTGDLVAAYAMEGGKEKSGIGGGIWMSGGGLASDNPGRMFFATGNGYASQLADDPIPGRSPPTALEEAVVNMVINDNGKLTPVDFFMPWEKRDLDAMDKDLGTSGFVLLDPGTFGTDSVKRIGCVAGKTGKLYFLNLEDLGGYQMGPGRRDKVLQTVQMPAPVFSSAGSYPAEGGYVYISPVGKETVAFKFGKDAAGNPVFTQAGKTEQTAAGRQGVGHGTVTSLNGQPGTGILWVVDVEGVNLRAYSAVPVNGILTPLLMLNNPGQSKFSRPTFGNGRVYLTTTNGFVTALGSPVNMPFNCSGPYEAGTVLIGNQTTTEITCIAKIAVTVNTIELDAGTGSPTFNLTGLPTFPATFALGGTLKFNTVFKPSTVGPLSTTINIRTTNGGGQQYAINTPVVIRGVARSVNPIAQIQPNVLSFGELVTGSNETATLDFGLENVGEGPMTVRSYQWSTESTDGPYITTPAPAPDATGTYNIGPYQLTGLPNIGGQVPGNDRALTTVRFAPTTDGYFKLYLVIQTSGGTKNVGIFGTAGAAPHAFFEWKTANGTWIPYVSGTPLDFGNVMLGGQQVQTLRLTNKGGTTLTTTISKPPVSGPLAALNGLGSIAEGSQLEPGKFEEAQLICAPPKAQVNMSPLPLTAHWTINNNDPLMGKQVIQFTCAGTSPQLGPLNSKAQGKYRYLGCYKDADPDRRMDTLLYYSQTNDNGQCMNDCASRGYIFSATEYEGECWCGHKPAVQLFPDTSCQYLCKGNYTQYCGGDGAYMSLFADEDRYTPGNSTSTTTSAIASTTAAATPTATGTPTATDIPITTTTATTTTVSSVPSSRPNFVYLGCANEPSGNRALTKDAYASSTLTPAICQDYCTSKGYPLSGMEYSTECYCGNSLSSGSTIGGSTSCTMPCGGDASQICGGPGALSVYNNTALVPPRVPAELPSSGEYTSLGCYTEGTNGRALVGGATAAGNMTVGMCVGYCRGIGMAVAGVEYSTECFCGNEIANGAIKATDGGCNMLCGGDQYSYCGGPGRLNMYSRSGTSTPSSTPIASSTPTPIISTSAAPPVSTTTPTTTSASSTPSPPSTSPWVLQGCYSEPPNGRALTGPSTAGTMTAQKCLSFCAAASNPLAGLEYGNECFCGLSLSANSTLSPTADCSMPCTGDASNTNCGGPSRLTIYRNPNIHPPVTPPSVNITITSTTGVKSNITYALLGCYTEPASARALPGYAFADDAMTLEMCVKGCQAQGFAFAGAEYARECYCGAALSTASVKVDQAECGMLCAGDKGSYCGGSGGRLGVYKKK